MADTTEMANLGSAFNDVFYDVFDAIASNFTSNFTSNSTNGTAPEGCMPPQQTSSYLVLYVFSLFTYGAPVLIILGTFGNVMSAIVMLRKELCQGSTTSLYLAVLAFVDIGALYTGLLRQWIFYTFQPTDIRALSRVSCRLHFFITYALQQYQAWIIVNVTLERLVAVFVPHKASIIFTRTRAVICICVTAFVICCINFHFFFTVDQDVYIYVPRDCDGDGVVEPTPPSFKYCTYSRFILKTWPWIDLAMFSLIPSIILIGSNLAIICKMASVRHMHDRSAAAQARITGMTIILLTVSIVFLITTMPISIYIIMNEFMPENLSPQQADQMQLAWACVNLLVYVNNVVNFFLYCISGTRFRREVISLLFACVGKKRSERSNGNSYVMSESKTQVTQANSATS